MASVYTNDLRLEEIGSGEQSGTWGDTTNTNLELIAEGFSFGTEAITTNADTHTSTVADGATDPARSMYIKYTGTLDSTCTITIAPNTLSRMHFIENGTSGSQDIIISQGSGANVTIPAGDVKAVYLDGAGSGAAVTNAFASLNVGNLTATTSDNSDNLTLVSTDADASVGPSLNLYRNSSSPADNDIAGRIQFNSRNDNSQDVTYSEMYITTPDVSDGTEDGQLHIDTMVAGTSRSRVKLIPAETVFNENGVDIDFRVESDNHDNLFFVDGGNDGIGIGNSTIIDWSTNYPGLQMGQAGVLYGHKSSNQMTFGMNWGVTTGNVYIADGIASRIVMDTSKISFDTSASGSAAGSITGINTLQMTSSGSVFNEDSADLDFRIESNGNANMLFVDGGNDHVNIGTSSDLGGVFNVSGATSSQFHSTDRHLMSLVSTEAGASDGPRLILQRDSSTPADNDQLGIIEFYGENDADEAVEYARINASILDASDGTEDGAFAINTRIAGANVNRLYMPPTETVFNENSSDQDFRVESDSNSHMIFTDAEVDRVAIGHSAPVGKLDVMGQGTSSTNLSMVIGADEGGTINPSRSNNTDKACRIGLPHRETSEENAAIMVCSSTAGANDVSIGGGTGVMNGATSVQIYTAANSTTTTGTSRLKVHSNGNVKIGSNPDTLYSSAPLIVEREESSNDAVIRTRHPSTNSRFHLDFFNSSGSQGNITVNSGSVSYNSTSDYRKKENVNYSWDGTTELKKLKPAKFNFIGDSDTIQGFLAHEVSSVVPVAVMGNKDEVTTKSNVVLDSNSVVVALGISEEEWEAGKQDILYEDGDAIPPEFSVGDVKQGQKYPSDSTWEASKDVPEYQSMDASKLVPLLVKTIQELEARITALEG